MEDETRIKALLIEDKSGRGAVIARSFIDCSGDGDLAAFAGARFEKGDENGNTLYPTMMFRAAGIIAPAAAPDAGPLRIDQVADRAPDHERELPATSHVSIVDVAGNAVAFTTSIERAFGSYVMARGFLLNNQMTDFAARPRDGETPNINRVEPGKRPRSSMSPETAILRTPRRISYFATVGFSASTGKESIESIRFLISAVEASTSEPITSSAVTLQAPSTAMLVSRSRLGVGTLARSL